jgi:iron(III) transport system ATP-binding protein
MSIRQHEIEISPAQSDPGENAISGRVSRNVFLGANRDYIVDLADGTQIRVTARPAVDLPVGSMVTLRLPPARCRILSG